MRFCLCSDERGKQIYLCFLLFCLCFNYYFFTIGTLIALLPWCFAFFTAGAISIFIVRDKRKNFYDGDNDIFDNIDYLFIRFLTYLAVIVVVIYLTNLIFVKSFSVPMFSIKILLIESFMIGSPFWDRLFYYPVVPSVPKVKDEISKDYQSNDTIGVRGGYKKNPHEHEGRFS